MNEKKEKKTPYLRRTAQVRVEEAGQPVQHRVQRDAVRFVFERRIRVLERRLRLHVAADVAPQLGLHFASAFHKKKDSVKLGTDAVRLLDRWWRPIDATRRCGQAETKMDSKSKKTLGGKNENLPEVVAEGALQRSGGRVALLPLGRGRDDLDLAPVGKLFFELFVHLLLQLHRQKQTNKQTNKNATELLARVVWAVSLLVGKASARWRWRHPSEKKMADGTDLAEVFAVLDLAEDAARQGVEDVEAVDAVAAGDGDVEADQGGHVGPRDAQRRVQAAHKVGQLAEGDELRRVRIEPAQAISL